MSRRDFTKVSPNLWRSRRFRSLSNAGKVVYFFLLTTEHQNSTGCFRLPDGYACADLDWPAADYLAARAELVQAELISFDEETSILFVRNWFKHSPPMNDKHAQGTAKLIAEIESDCIREVVESEFTAANGIRPSRSAGNLSERPYRTPGGRA